MGVTGDDGSALGGGAPGVGGLGRVASWSLIGVVAMALLREAAAWVVAAGSGGGRYTGKMSGRERC